MARPKRPPPPSTADDIERQFYEALQHGDLDGMMALWANDADVVCVHPGGGRIVGPQAIRAAFEAVFSNGGVDARPSRVRRVQSAELAVHSVIEQVQVATDEGVQAAWVVATNVYIHTPLGWRLVAHHAGPGALGEAPDEPEAVSVLH